MLEANQPEPQQSAVPGEVRATRFVLVDAHGRDRARISLNPEGEPGIVLLSPSGDPRLILSLATEGLPSVAMFDGETKLRVWIEVDEFGSGVRLCDKDEAVRVGVLQSNDNGAIVCFIPEENAMGPYLGFTAEGKVMSSWEKLEVDLSAPSIPAQEP